jgi:hypothetical protein
MALAPARQARFALSRLPREALEEGADAVHDDRADRDVGAQLEEGQAQGPAAAPALGDASRLEDGQVAERRSLVHSGLARQSRETDLAARPRQIEEKIESFTG